MISLILLIGEFLNKYNELYKKNKEIIYYLIVGVLTTIVSIVSYNAFRTFIKNYLICTILSWVVAVAFAYITNRKYVFQSKEKNIVKEVSKFTISRLLSLGFEIIIMWILVDALKVNDRVAKVMVQFVIIVLNYVFSKLLVFTNNDKNLKNA